jgi:DNA-binding NtrC family response regulator
MDNSKPRILIADDQPDVLIALRLLLKGEGYETESANSPAGILAALESRDFDAVLMDLNYARDTTSGQEGLDLLCRIQALDSTIPVIVMTAWGSVQIAVEAMRRGARDFIQKPWENPRLLTILRTQVELGQALRRGQRLEAGGRRQLKTFFWQLGQAWRALHGHRLAVLAGGPEFESAFGMRPISRRLLMNGPVRCVLLQYQVV